MNRPEVKAKMKKIQIERNPSRDTQWYNNGTKSFRLKPDDPRVLDLNLKEGRLTSIEGFVYENQTCPHCGKVGSGGNMKRYHFDNCKKVKGML